MKIVVHGPRAAVVLEAPGDFDRFAVVDETGSAAALAAALAPYGRLAPDGDAVVSVAAVVRLAGPLADDPDWRRRFDAMLAGARARGWIEEDSAAIRAHVERTA